MGERAAGSSAVGLAKAEGRVTSGFIVPMRAQKRKDRNLVAADVRRLRLNSAFRTSHSAFEK